MNLKMVGIKNGNSHYLCAQNNKTVIYPAHFEQKLGVDKIRCLLKNKCLSPLGIEEVDRMAFSSNYEEICRLLAQTDEFVRLIGQSDDFPVSFYFDIRQSLQRIRIEGTYLDEAELFDLRRSLETLRNIVSFFSREESQTFYPELCNLSHDVSMFPQVLSAIDAVLGKFGKIKDTASPELGRIRNDLSRISGSISRTLSGILKAAQSDGVVDKDAAPTVRDGRLVIPVSPAYKRKIKGIVHDESATGKTVFIEPTEVVEANNRIRELENEERREIIRILVETTGLIRPLVPDLSEAYRFLGKIDFTRAKALWAIETESIKPIMVNKPYIDWGRAQHPLLFLSLKKQNKRVVSLEIKLDEATRMLIVSGPNAGGKSVCLKTVGLLQYLLQCGMLVAMHETSQAGIFEHIFVDIGDEQSIENDLSTYSSHLSNMKYFLRNAQNKTIVLIDEFGSGTEPQIGGAIAEAVLERFYQENVFAVITTHYHNLKHFADHHTGVLNGAMLYDRHEMRPLFQLEVGRPGSSFAVEIARKIGLPEQVVLSAISKVGQDYIDMDKYLQDVMRDKRYWENKRQTIRQKEKKLDELLENYENDLLAIDKQRKEIVREARQNAEQLLKEANVKIENTIREIKEAEAERERTKQARKTLQAYKNELETRDDNDPLTQKMQRMQANRKKRKKEPLKNGETLSESKETFAQGDSVRIKGQQAIGQVVSVGDKTAVVALGMLKSSLPIDRLEKVSNRTLKKEGQRDNLKGGNRALMEVMHQKRLNFKHEIDVRGMRADEALQAVTYFIDDAIQVGVSQVRILHGTGSGILRQIIRDYLRVTAGVRAFYDEHVQHGGAGITVVDFE